VTIWPVAADEDGSVYNAKIQTNRDAWYAPTPGTRYTSQNLTLEWDQVRLPAILGYVVNSKGGGADAGCALAVSRGGIRLTLHGLEYSIKIPSNMHCNNGEWPIPEKWPIAAKK
jgi:hypothetical protein